MSERDTGWMLRIPPLTYFTEAALAAVLFILTCAIPTLLHRLKDKGGNGTFAAVLDEQRFVPQRQIPSRLYNGEAVEKRRLRPNVFPDYGILWCLAAS